MEAGTVFLGTIAICAPEFGIALVVPELGMPSIKELYLAHLPMNDASTGAVNQADYVDGASVVCIVNNVQMHSAYILGPINYAAKDFKDTLQSEALYNIGEFSEWASKLSSTAIAHELKWGSLSFKNFAHGVDRDAIPGDNDTIDQKGNAGIHVGRYIAQLRGSPICYVDASNVTNKIRLVAPSIEEHGPLTVRLSDKELSVCNTAVNDNEAFGYLDASPLMVSDGEVALADENALPLYRIQQTGGAAVDGKELLVVGYPGEGAHYCTTEAPILAKKRVSLSGELTEASAASISTVKSPLIQAIHQIAYDKSRSPQEQRDILYPWEYQEAEEEEQKEPTPDSIDDAAINKILDRLLTGDYLEKLKSKLAEHGLKVAPGETVFAEIGEQKTGPSTNPAYDLPPAIQLKDPVTGKVTTYFASTSFISQEADGSILICDGYGSEIRMSRGNIYISPALDLFLRPGRDLSAMVPRHQSFNAQEHTTINSSKSVYIRAVNDLKMVGATEGLGVVTLECMAQDNAPNTGLLLKSGCGTTVIGNDIYIGRNTGTGTSEKRIDPPQKAGSIIIDACDSGVLSEQSGEHVVDSHAVCLISSQNNTAAALRVTPSMIGIYANGVELPAVVNMTGKRSPEEVNVVRNGIVTTLRLSTYTGDPQLTVGGALLVGGRFWCNGAGWFCGQVGARGVASTSQYCGVVDTSYDDPFKKIEIKKQEPHDDAGSATANYISQFAAAYNYQDSYVTYNGFAFPLDYGVSPALRVPGMVWQTNEASIQNSKRWQEIPVKIAGSTEATMCYPGITVWESERFQVSGPDSELLSVNGNYITNIPKGN